jgi:hypothetical protein
MASLVDLFNPTFLMFLGVLVLVVSGLVVYFESKLREQNHKMTAMLSLVSTLAEDMNGVKLGFNQLAYNQMNGNPANEIMQQTPIVNENSKLIVVSDDEASDDDDDDSVSDDVASIIEDDEASVIDDDYASINDNEDSESDSDDEEEKNIKVLKLNINDIDDEITDLNLNVTEDLEDLEELNEELEYLEDSNSVEEMSEPMLPISKSDFKTINITLEEKDPESLDYKKLNVQRLREIVVEKGLIDHASKLKKNEALKLLGIE